MDKLQRDLDRWIEREQPDNNGYPEFIDGEDLPPANVHKYSIDTDRCVCGGIIVYFEDAEQPGEGCEVEGSPWTDPNWCGTTDEYDYQEDSYDS